MAAVTKKARGGRGQVPLFTIGYEKAMPDAVIGELMRAKVDLMTEQSMAHIPDRQGEEIVAVLEGIKRQLLGIGHRGRRRNPVDPKSRI